MSKEIYISTTPHETRLAIVEDEQLTEIYYERENEYTLAGSIYNGKVTRVLPGMQSSFVDIGLERDAFLYVTDFMEEQGDAADFESDSSGSRRQPPREASAEPVKARVDSRARHDRGERNAPRQGEKPERHGAGQAETGPVAETESTISFDEPIAPAPNEAVGTLDSDAEGAGSRRWRGRRGRRRGRGLRDESVSSSPATETVDADPETGLPSTSDESGLLESVDAAEASPIEIDLTAETPKTNDAVYKERERGSGRNRRGRGDRDRGPRQDREQSTPAFDNSYAGYATEEKQPEATGEPVLLPGESIRKYRDPAEVAAEDEQARRNEPQQAQAIVVAAPTIEIQGWDGGAVLPGETLSRKRPRLEDRPKQQHNTTLTMPSEAFAEPSETPVDAEKAEVLPHSAPSPIASSGDFAAASAPDEPAGLTELPTRAVSEAAVEAAAMGDPAMLPGESDHVAQPEVAPVALEVEASTEYEPEEGAAATLADTGRRDVARFQQTNSADDARQRVAQIEQEADRELVGATADPTTYDLAAGASAEPESHHEQEADLQPAAAIAEPEFTSLAANGEMISMADDALTQHVNLDLPSQDIPHSTVPTAHEGAVKDPDLSFAGEEQLTSPPEGSFETLDTTVHAYGDGDFYEEELDGELDVDEDDFPATLAHAEDGEVEYEEETLDDSSDPGSLLHDMSQDGRESEDVEEKEEITSNAGGFTEADFGGEPEIDDEEVAVADPGSSSHRQSPRDGNRSAGHGRDRRGGRNSGDRGRGNRRQSMQTTDLPAINELLKPGQEILVQIAKEPIAKKGARITSHIALPGRFLVFMPTVNHTGVSRKISSDEERRRLKSILLSEKGDAQGGFIVRTAAGGASEEELRNDLRFLIQMWTDIKMRSESSKSPALIYHDLNLVERILRDQVTDNFSAIWVDTEQEYERVLRFLQRFQPSLVRRVKLYTKETPLFEHFGVNSEIDKALKSKVWLKSGGSIVINQTEALVAIDINTGKYVGKTARLEDTILKTNLDAIPEIVRQIRLRDLGGIIVIDFIDMDERKNRAKVMQALEDAMHTDRAPSKILPFNDFGLVIMTRKRVKQSLERTLCMPDPVTDGTGMIKSPITIANEIYVEMRKMHRHLEKADVMLRVHPEVVKTLKANGGKRLQELEEMTRKTILVKSDPSLSPEAFDIH